ncbi:MAG TPA: hypothetical protein VF353_02420, partial [Candidatus Binatia bacterium]
VSEPLKNQCSEFLECIRTGCRPVSDAIAGREVVRVMEAIDFSMQYKGVPVPLERGKRAATNVRPSPATVPIASLNGSSGIAANGLSSQH